MTEPTDTKELAFDMPSMLEESMSKVLQKACTELHVVTVEAQSMLRVIAGPRYLGESVKAHLRRLARRLGWEVSRTSNIHYGRARIIRAEEWIRLNDEFAALTKSASQRQGELHDTEILARAVAAQAGKAPRPLGVEDHAAGQARHWPQRRT